MLAVGVDPPAELVAVGERVVVARCDPGSKTAVLTEREHLRTVLARDLGGVVGRSVVDHEHVDVRQLGVKLFENVRKVRLLVPGRDEHERASGSRHGARLHDIRGASCNRRRPLRSRTWSTWEEPTFADVLEARRWIAPYLAPTPLYAYPLLDEVVGADVFVKHENHQPVGAFKVRGGVNLVGQLDRAERERGVFGASTGNHGQSIAYAARLFGVQRDDLRARGGEPREGRLDARASGQR